MAYNWRDPWQDDRRPPYSPIPPPKHPNFDMEKVIQAALSEDSADIGDITTMATVGKEEAAIGTFLAKADGILAGLAVAEMVFRIVDPSLAVRWSFKDGDAVKAGTRFGTVEGHAYGLIVAERVVLNFMQRMSGIATMTAKMHNEVKGTNAKVIETRKTAPGLRLLDKWAVLIGGGANHRMGLFDMVMIKDNHVTAAGGITAAVGKCQEYLRTNKKDVPVEIETRTLEEVKEVLHLHEAGKAQFVTRVMLDNMAKSDSSQSGGVDVKLLKEAVDLINGRFETEASGNVTLATVKPIAQTGVTFISCGALTHSVMALDISLKISLASNQ